jgi:hypothetical protein
MSSHSYRYHAQHPGEEMEMPSTTPRTKRMIEWSYVNEEILAEWCDIAQCYKWLNYHSYMYYSTLNMWFTIPVISFSTLNGTASFIQIGLSDKSASTAPMVIGTVSILIGILSTIQQYFKISELKESYRMAYIAWDKYARNISIELAKAPKERLDAGTFIKLSRQEYDRLMENNQIIPPHIIKKFNEMLQGTTEKEKERFSMIRKPDICDTIVSINETRHMWFKEEDMMKDIFKDDDDYKDIEKQTFSRENLKRHNEEMRRFDMNTFSFTNPLKSVRGDGGGDIESQSPRGRHDSSPASILVKHGTIRSDKKKNVTHQSDKQASEEFKPRRPDMERPAPIGKSPYTKPDPDSNNASLEDSDTSS